MSYAVLARKLLLNKERYMSEKELKEYCKIVGLSYDKAVTYLGRCKYIVRILKGFFYVPSIEERKLKTGKPYHLEAIAKALEYKGVKEWYAGLETAIKLNGITHEFFTIDYIISDKIFRPKPFKILGHKVKFVKVKKELLGFGIKKGKIPYSDLEKTLLDLIYLRKYSGRSDKAIKDELIEWFETASKSKIKKYSKHYSKNVRKLAEEML